MLDLLGLSPAGRQRGPPSAPSPNSSYQRVSIHGVATGGKGAAPERGGAPGPAFYDDEAIFATYTAHRHRPGNPNDTLEGPAFLAMLGPVEGLRVVDLGCGDAGFGRALLGAGCAAYTGVDGSRRMCAAARRTLEGTAGRVVESTIEAWDAPPGSVDVVVSRLALHYVADVAAVFARAHRALVDGGRLVFSVEHPVITSCARGWQPGTPRQEWVVDDYHVAGPRVTRWLGGDVLKHHRTVEEYFGALRRAGFAVEELGEGRPQLEHLGPEEHVRRGRIPLFLLLAARKSAAPGG
jgi:SAM-dependent methyltransferase